MVKLCGAAQGSATLIAELIARERGAGLEVELVG